MDNPKKESFECYVCLEKRFLSLGPPCDHKICSICVLKTFEAPNLNDKCGMCRSNLPETWDGYKLNFHNIADLKSEEHERAAIAATHEGNLPLLKHLLAKNHFAIGERVQLIGLQKRKDLNGIEGMVTQLFVTSTSSDVRHAVELPSGKRISIKPKNLRHSELETGCVLIAAEDGDIDILKFLAEKKVDLNRANDDGSTPVWIAACKGHTEIVKLLAEENADLNLAKNNGATPVYVAAGKGHTEIVKILAEHKADLNRADDGAIAPITAAVVQGHTDVVKILIDSDANVEDSLLSLATGEIKEIIAKALLSWII